MGTVYWVGIDQGTTKTALAVAEPDGTVIHSDALKTVFNRQATDQNAIHADRLQTLLSRREGLPLQSKVRVVASMNVPLTQSELRAAFNQHGLRVTKFEQASDALGQFGLSSMTPGSLVFCAGSYYIGGHFNHQGDMHLLKWPYPTATAWGSGICAYRYGLFLLDAYATHKLAKRETEVTQGVESVLGPPRKNETVYAYIYRHKTQYPHGWIMQLAPLMTDLIRDPDVEKAMRQQTDNLLRYLDLLADDAKDPAPAKLVLAGAPIVKQPTILGWIKEGWTRSPVEVVESGNPAAGTIRFRVRYPQARIRHHGDPRAT